jgi:oligopeptide/dipeptide ABC transporter ATP-binding protein
VSASDALITVRGLRKHFPVRKGVVAALFGRTRDRFLRAVDGVDFAIQRGEVLGLAGESGSGKTTIGMILALLDRPTGGAVSFDGVDPFHLKGKKLKDFRRNTQIIFQDPYQTLNPRLRVIDTVAEPLDIHGIGRHGRARHEMAVAALVLAGLPEQLAGRYPHELSGGQRQRVAIARAMVLRPRFIVADEPVSMLDVSVRSGVMSLMLKLKREFRVTYLFISHDLAASRYMCDRIAVMYLGRIMEVADKETIIQRPVHPYTQVLLSAVPVPDPFFDRKRVRVPGETPSPIDLPPGCRFAARCPRAVAECRETEPDLRAVAPGHLAACHLAAPA